MKIKHKIEEFKVASAFFVLHFTPYQETLHCKDLKMNQVTGSHKKSVNFSSPSAFNHSEFFSKFGIRRRK
jgi:hypothetical protein